MQLHIKMLLFLFAVFLALPAAASADVAVIVNKDNKTAIDDQFLVRAFSGRVSQWPSKGTIILVELPENSPSTVLFYNKLLRKSPAAVREIWSNNYFTGKAATLPRQLASDDEVKRAIAGNKNAIGYIDASSVDASIRVVNTFK